MLTVLPDLESDDNDEEVRVENRAHDALGASLLTSNFRHLSLSHIRSHSFCLARAEQLNLIYNRKSLAAILIIGFVRDVIWAWQTVRNQNYFHKKLNGFWGLTLTQMIGTLPGFFITPPFILYVFSGSAGFQHNKQEWIKRLAIFSAASWSAVPVWNGAQWLGTWTGNKIQLSPSNANYFAGLLTGSAETIWQNAIVIPFLFDQPINRIETLLNILGGAVSQWVLIAGGNYWQGKEDKEYIISPIIALSVCIITLAMTMLAWHINNLCQSNKRRSPQGENIHASRLEKTILDRNRLFTKPSSSHTEIIVSPRRLQGILP